LQVGYENYYYPNGKMRPAETIPGKGQGEIKEKDGGDEFN
jgi:hypothetical protein